PFGSILKNVRAVGRTRPEDGAPSPRKTDGEALTRSTTEPAPSKDTKQTVPEPMPVAAAAAPPPRGSSPDDPMNLAVMPPMEPPAEGAQSTPAGSTPGTDTTAVTPEPSRVAGEEGDLTDVNRNRTTSLNDVGLIRDADGFAAAFKRLGPRGGTLRIAAQADLELPTLTIEAPARVQLVAEPGTRRPRLRFRPAPADIRSGSEWIAMLSVRSGSLHLQGIDLVVADLESLRTD